MKRKHLLKSLLVAVGLLVGGNAWAEETRTSVYSNNFETSSDWTAKGKTDGWTCNPGQTTANTFASKVIGVGAGSGDMGLVSPSFTFESGTELVDVEMKFKMDACTSGKSSGIEFITSDVDINSGYVKTGTPFFAINASANGNGYWGTIAVGGTNQTSALNQTGTYENNNLNRNTTGIVVLKVRFNFTSKIATYTLSKVDGTPLVASTTVSFANSNASTLDRIFIHAGKTYGGVTVDDVNVYSVKSDAVAVTYSATFTESNGLNPDITIYTDAERTTTIVNGLLEDATTYYYTASLVGYKDYMGTFAVDGSAPVVNFTMEAKQQFTFNVFAVDESSNKLLNDPIATSTKYGGETAELKWSKYILVSGKWYVSKENSFHATSTEALDKNVIYTPSDIDYFIECENMHGVRTDRWVLESNASNSGYYKIRQNQYYRTIYTDIFAEGGTFKLAIPYNNGNSANSTSYIQSRDSKGNVTNIATFTTENGSHTYAPIITIPAGCSLAIYYPGEGNSNARMDYLTLKKISSMSIVGDFSENGWDATDGIQMVQDVTNPAIWTAVVENYEVKSDDMWFEYKAVANNNWDDYVLGNPEATNADKNQEYNFDYTGAGAGTYKLTFTVNTTANTVELAIEKQVVLNSFTVSYVDNDGWGNIHAYTFNSETLGGWPGTAMTEDREVNGNKIYTITFTAENAPAKIMFNNGSDASKTGELDFVNNSLYGIAWPTVTVSDAGYKTYCSPYAIDFSEATGLTAYRATVSTENNESKVSFSEVTEVPAGEGVLLKLNDGFAAGDFTVKPIATAAAIDNDFIGVLAETQITTPGIFVLMNGGQGVGFYKTGSAFTVGANTAYLPAIAAHARDFIGFGDDTTTGIQSMDNGKLTMDNVYNLNGQRVVAPQKGLYIVNGKKVILK